MTRRLGIGPADIQVRDQPHRARPDCAGEDAGLYRDGAAASVSGREVLDEVREIRRRRPVDDPLPALYD